MALGSDPSNLTGMLDRFTRCGREMILMLNVLFSAGSSKHGKHFRALIGCNDIESVSMIKGYTREHIPRTK
jgi:hypothetical protein